jgi:hypothetical protein
MTSVEHSEVRQEPDRVPLRRALWLSALTLAIGALGVLVSAELLRRSNISAPARARVSGAGPRPIPLEHSEIAHAERGLALKSQQRKMLSRYGWVDRDAGVVRIPIERAMDLRAEASH